MDKTQENLLVFGYGLGLIATIFGVVGLIKHGIGLSSLILLVCAGIFIVTTTFKWEALKIGYRGWMKITGLIGSLVTIVVFSGVFFLIFVPIRLLLKLSGRDHLQRNKDSSTQTYWLERSHIPYDEKRYLQQF